MTTKKAVYFYRNYRGFTGGHLKVWDYYNHVKHSTGFFPFIFFGKGSSFETDNPWKVDHDSRMPEWNPEHADVLFLGGEDWLSLPEATRKSWPRPVINLAGQRKQVISLENQPKGMYFIRLFSDEKSETAKILKQ
jgi:hypothetical protein